MTEYVVDIECDGLKPTKIHCIVTEDVTSDWGGYNTSSHSNMATHFESLGDDDYLIGHNIIQYDIPVLERLLNIKIKAKLVDTLALSWYLFPNRSKHGLES